MIGFLMLKIDFKKRFSKYKLLKIATWSNKAKHVGLANVMYHVACVNWMR